MPSRPAVSFLFGGRLSLDLTWTVRFRSVLPTDLLAEPHDLTSWLRISGLPAPERPTARHVADTRELREAIFRCAEAVIDGRPVEDADITVVNRWAAAPPPAPVLAADLTRHLSVPDGHVMSASLSAIARDAVDLFTSAADGRLRRCSGPQCSLLFHDDSRPGTRRWCTTARCGNVVNARAYRDRRRSTDPT